jgi:hypothetical protein
MVLESVLTAMITVIIGVSVYALSQMVSKFVIEPIHKQDELRGEIGDALIYYANVYGNPGKNTPKHTEAMKKFRQQASLLISKTALIRKYPFFAWTGLVPTKQNVLAAHANLIGLSNGVNMSENGTQNVKWADETRILLRI